MEHTREWFDAHREEYKYKLCIGCANCSSQAEHLHHIVPLVLGGTNNQTNVIQLCSKCHGLIHNATSMTNKSLQAEGIAQAKQQGKHLGRPKAEYPISWYATYTAWKNNEITAKIAMEKLDLKRTTFYKLVKMYEEEQGTQIKL